MIVIFSADNFRLYYPKITADLVSDEELQVQFDVACSFINNTDNSPFPYNPLAGVTTRKTMLYLMMCHLLGSVSTVPLGQAGVAQSASQGSVSVGFSGVNTAQFGMWLTETPCGRALWQLMRPYALGGLHVTHENYHPYG